MSILEDGRLKGEDGSREEVKRVACSVMRQVLEVRGSWKLTAPNIGTTVVRVHEMTTPKSQSSGQQTPSPADLEKLQGPYRVLSMHEFASLVRDIPFPTASQRENFVEYITTAHSWYKHLPLYLPGEPFYFYFDRFAGCDWQCGFFVEKKERGWHYSAMPTAEHRDRFGFLSYCFFGIEPKLLNRNTIPWEELTARLGMYAQLAAMPQPLLDAGRVELTAAIHPLSQSYHFWDYTRSHPQLDIHWPEESGGEATLKRILKRCAEMRQPEYRLEENRIKRQETMELLIPKVGTDGLKMGDRFNRIRADPVLHELLEPERARQKKEMLTAIDRICALIQDELVPPSDDFLNRK